MEKAILFTCSDCGVITEEQPKTCNFCGSKSFIKESIVIEEEDEQFKKAILNYEKILEKLSNKELIQTILECAEKYFPKDVIAIHYKEEDNNARNNN